MEDGIEQNMSIMKNSIMPKEQYQKRETNNSKQPIIGLALSDDGEIISSSEPKRQVKEKQD
jgi:hypothetical protein